jgi:hypothetical protein
MNVFICKNFLISTLPDLDKKSRTVVFTKIGLNVAKRTVGQNPISINMDQSTADVLSELLGTKIAPSAKRETVKSGDLIVIAKQLSSEKPSLNGSTVSKFEFYTASVQ